MANETKQYEEFFKEADKDNSGTLTLDELTESLRNHGYTGTDADIKRFFRDMDFTSDKEISFEEYMMYMRQKPAEYHKSAVMRNAFEAFDKDKSGAIDKAELQAIFTECGHVISDYDAKQMIAKADKDGSGTLDYEEFISALFGYGC